MTITFEIDFDGTDLPVSSFSYRSDPNGDSGSIIIQGTDYLQTLTDGIETGTITINKVEDAVSTEILTASIDEIDVSEGPTQSSLSISLTDISFSGSIPASFAVDDLSEFNQLQGGFWSFRLSEIEQGYQRGMEVTYLSVTRYIASVAVSWSADSFGTVTLTEGPEPPDDEETEDEPGLPGCTYTLTIGAVSSPAFDVFCSSGYLDPGTTYVSPEGYTYDMFVFRCGQFTMPAEASITVEVGCGRPALDVTGTATGFEWDIIQGEYTPFTNPAPTVYTLRGDGSFTGTIPAGVYTVRLTLYIDRSVNPLSWITTSYTIYPHS